MSFKWWNNLSTPSVPNKNYSNTVYHNNYQAIVEANTITNNVIKCRTSTRIMVRGNFLWVYIHTIYLRNTCCIILTNITPSFYCPGHPGGSTSFYNTSICKTNNLKCKNLFIIQGHSNVLKFTQIDNVIWHKKFPIRDNIGVGTR